MVQLFQKALNDPTLQLILRPEWGAQNETYQDLIKRELNLRLGGTQQNSSISHTVGLGGFCLSSQVIGFDVEVSSRVTSAAARRICSEAELESFGSPAAIWCAKEAAFKSLSKFNQPQKMIEIQVESLAKDISGLTRFQFKEPRIFGVAKTLGVVFQEGLLTYAIVLVQGAESN